MTDSTTLLDAGALVPIKAKVKNPAHVDEISARIYHHPGLGDRPVVRLTADKLAQGDDLEMEFLGFEEPEVAGPLAYRRRQALGFPGWALIHDPDHARFALELVKEFKKAARKSKSKPGHGYDAFVDIAKRLGKSVAHFLPSFWEQVGREFIQVGNNTYASRAFGKAREAEKVHALKVDEKLRQDAFLEFALAGCLSNKALTEYGKELQKSLPGKEAWQFFRELCIRRTLGGMPPWTSLIKDVKPLISDAQLDVDAEIQSLLAEILESPAMSRAAIGFWKSSAPYLVPLARENDRVAGILLNLLPETSRWDRSDVWKWLELLDEWEVLPNAWNNNVGKEAGPDGGTAAWFSRLSTISDEPPQRLFAVLSSAAPKLKKEKKPINLTVESWGSKSVNIDLLDLALELKVPLADPPDDTEMSLTEWASPGDDAVDRPRDPVFVHKHKRFVRMLENAVPNAAGQAEFEAAAKGKTALAAARKNWLMNLIARVSQGGLPDADEALQELGNKTSRETYREFPEAYEKLQAVDLVPVLGRTLAGGVVDEYGWPIAEDVADRLRGKNGKQDVQVYGRFPYLMLTDGLNVVVVDHEKIVLEHELQIPKKSKLEDLFFCDGQLCVFFEGQRYASQFYWSNNPKKTKEHYHFSSEKIGGAVVDLPAGGTFNGHKTIHAGDADPPDSPDKFHFDGEHFWKLFWADDGRVLREVDPKTGKEGRKSRPSFFEDYLKTGAEFLDVSSELMHLGDSVHNSPLGSQDGTVGWRSRKTQAGVFEDEGIDGRKWGKKDSLGGLSATALLDQPGSSEKLPITGAYGWNWGWSNDVALWDSGGTFKIAEWEEGPGPYNAGQITSFPVMFLHAMRLRDKKTSKKLRSTNQTQAKKLLLAVIKDIELSEEIEDPLADLSHAEDEIKKWLKSLEHPRLLRGLLGVVHHAGILAGRLRDLIESSNPESEEIFQFEPAMEATVETAMKLLDIDAGWGNSEPLFPHLGEIAAFIEGTKKTPLVSAAPFDWWNLLDQLDCRVWSAYWLSNEKDDGWLRFLEHWADLGLLDLPGAFRVLEGVFDGPAPVNPKIRKREEDWIGHHHQGNVFFLSQVWDEEWKIVEYAPEGKFRLLPKFQIDSEETFEKSWDSEQLRRFVAGARQHDKPFLPAEVRERLADQLEISPAEVGLVWLGFPNFGSWEKNFLPKPLREELQLKVAEAEAARQSLQALSEDARRNLLRSFLNSPAEDLWEDGSSRALDRLTSAWESIVPKRLSLPPGRIDQLTDAYPDHVDKGQMLVALAAPKTHPLLTAKADWRFGRGEDSYWTELYCEEIGETFNDDVLVATAISIPFLSYHLPVGDPGRATVPAVYDAALKCLQSPKLLLSLVEGSYYDDKDVKAGFKLIEKTLGKKVKKHNDGMLADDGLIVGYAETYRTQFAVRPSKLKTEKDYDRLRQVFEAAFDPDDFQDPGTLEAIRLLRSDGFKDLADRIKKTPVPEGCYEANPARSAVKLVKAVEGKLELSREAATLYLQTLTLPDCTSANIKRWNEWTTSVYNNGCKELVKQNLVLEAKRARAGRKHFLPGGWEALKLPHLPLETWKLPLYEITRDANGKLKTPLSRILPLKPVHELFEQAWQRIETGDQPAYEEVS